MINDFLDDYGRRELNVSTAKVANVLPEYFREDYPKLITLLDAYNNYMDSDGNVNDNLRELLKVRDVDGISLKFLEFLIQEIGNGLSTNKFTNPREIVRNLPAFYRIKGSLFSAKSFFRALYDEEAEIVYPKDNVFIVGESLLGAESLRYIQNGALYQTLSILIKTSKPISQWRELYKKYVHPAGFYLGGEILIESVINFGLNIMPDVIPDDTINNTEISGVAEIIFFTPYEPLTGFFQNPNDNTIYRVDLERYFTAIAEDSAGSISDQYGSMLNMATPNTVGMDDSNGITLSNEFETIDRSPFDSSSSNIWNT